MKTSPRRLAVQYPRPHTRRGYSSQAPKPSGNSALIYGGIGAVVLAGGGYWFYTQNVDSVDKAVKSGTGAAQKAVGFSPKTEDYQKVYDAIAKKLLDEDDYDDGSYAPVVLRLAWHSSGTYDKETGTGGSNGEEVGYGLNLRHPLTIAVNRPCR